jgi:hypothetical protein
MAGCGGGGGDTPLVTTGTITGTVTNSATSAPIPGATVATGTGGFSATTASNGTYTISNVPSGTYTLTASAPGFTSKTQGSVNVALNATTTQNFSLTSTGGNVTLAQSSDGKVSLVGPANAVNVTPTVQSRTAVELPATPTGTAFVAGAQVGPVPLNLLLNVQMRFQLSTPVSNSDTLGLFRYVGVNWVQQDMANVAVSSNGTVVTATLPAGSADGQYAILRI